MYSRHLGVASPAIYGGHDAKVGRIDAMGVGFRDDESEASRVTDPGQGVPAHVDLTTISLARLRTVDSPVLAECLARILRESEDGETPTAEFTSAV
jgi:FXSXX-COOH protein